MTLGCLTPTPNQIYPERMRIFPYGNSKEYLVLWKQVLNNSLDVLRKGRTSTPRKDRVNREQMYPAPETTRNVDKIYFKNTGHQARKKDSDPKGG